MFYVALIVPLVGAGLNFKLCNGTRLESNKLETDPEIHVRTT